MKNNAPALTSPSCRSSRTPLIASDAQTAAITTKEMPIATSGPEMTSRPPGTQRSPRTVGISPVQPGRAGDRDAAEGCDVEQWNAAEHVCGDGQYPAVVGRSAINGVRAGDDGDRADCGRDSDHQQHRDQSPPGAQTRAGMDRPPTGRRQRHRERGTDEHEGGDPQDRDLAGVTEVVPPRDGEHKGSGHHEGGAHVTADLGEHRGPGLPLGSGFHRGELGADRVRLGVGQPGVGDEMLERDVQAVGLDIAVDGVIGDHGGPPRVGGDPRGSPGAPHR